MYNSDLVIKFKRILSKKLNKFRKHGTQLTDKDIHNTITNDDTCYYVEWNIGHVYSLAQKEGLKINDTIAKQVLKLCWCAGQDFSVETMVFFIQAEVNTLNAERKHFLEPLRKGDSND